MPKKLELIGRVFGKLTVVAEDGRDPHGATMWQCSCECGNVTRTRGAQMVSGAVRSCGCGIGEAARINNTTHGMTREPIYRRWQAMLARCFNSNYTDFCNYGGRGITVCDRWRHSFENFESDMREGFSPELELDRINTDGNYEPGNCRWVTSRKQQRNKRTNHRIELNGVVLSAVEWSEKTGIPANTIIYRLRRGWTPEKALLELANK